MSRFTVVVDLDGVVYLGDRPVPGAGPALAAIEEAGGRLVYATNNSTRTAAEVAAVIARRVGHEVDPAAVATAAMATAEELAPRSPRAYVLGMAGLVTTLEEAGVAVVERGRDADTVVVGLDRALTYERLAEATLAVASGARFVATGTDRTFPMPEGPYPGAGALVAAVSTATGVEPLVCGKPHPPMVRLLRRLVGPGDAWVVGDRPETDIALARAAGWRSILVLTGVVDDPASVPAALRPDVVVPSIRDVPAVVTRSLTR